MNIERERLVSLVEYAQQSARLKSKPISNVTQHSQFSLYENQLRELPGIHLNVSGTDAEDEVWLAVDRLHEQRPPDITSSLLQPWVEMTQSPTERPRLLEYTDGARLIAAGTHRSSLKPGDEAVPPPINPGATIALADYEKAQAVEAQFTTYVTTKWQPWAAQEGLRRKTIRLYSQLFTLKQQLEGAIVEAQLELLWGVGMGIWQQEGTTVSYPLLGRLVELALNSETAQVEIRPRDMDARLELDWYASVDNPGVADLEKAEKEFFGKATRTFSPFDRGTFEPLLRVAATNLDANGIYWPNEVPAEERTLPQPDGRLKVTDTWVLFARPRTSNVFIQDLEKFKASAKEGESTETLPQAVAAIVTAPDTSNPIVELPSFRGVSASYQGDSGSSSPKANDLYFPKPFNNEQVRIVQLLEAHDGVVVQGPPGTGKTHTIANIICHYLAEGKRVLVTSMKDPALAVLQEQLPVDIRPLAIALLASEQEGMKQFEHAIHRIASEIQSLDRVATGRTIRHLEERIDVLHGLLIGIDHKISDWATRNLTKFALDQEDVDPQDAARELVQGTGQYEWIPDALSIGSEYAPQFGDVDVLGLRDARRALGKDIDYLQSSLPQVVELPDSRALLQVHQDLSEYEELKRAVESGEVPALADSSQETLAMAEEVLGHVQKLQDLREEVALAKRPWTAAMRDRLREGDGDEVIATLEALGADLVQAVDWHNTFLKRPVSTPPGLEVDLGLAVAIRNLTEGRSPFGLRGLVGQSEGKKKLDSIRVLGVAPTNVEGWRHVSRYLGVLKRLRELALRWNAIVRELPLEAVPNDTPGDGLVAAGNYGVYSKVRALVNAERELAVSASRMFPNWSNARQVDDSEAVLSEFAAGLRHHLTKSRLANVWVIKERSQQALVGRNGRIAEDLREFLAVAVGDPAVPDAELQRKWSALTAELSRVLGVTASLATVSEACKRIADSGAPKFAETLRQPLRGTVDSLLPDNWRKSWRLKRLSTHLESIDAHSELKKLAKARRETADDLSRAYGDIVVKRTWLKLAENASPSIRAALQAYLNAIQRIGKGTGKRAVRYRHDARTAASQANPAVPCWIMAHYRVSESLPAELGCFDLVIIDEASQSDLTALPSVLRAKKVLIVGDDKQVSPEGVGLEEEKVRSLMSRFLGNQVETYRPQMSPERSIYDLFKVVFARSAVMLKEHFRCAAPIIEYSKREFYNHELRPLRMPQASERLDPPLIDVLVTDGYRRGDTNLPEARFIVDEIKAIAADPSLSSRSIGVVSLLADKQALEIWNRLTDELGPELMQRHNIACGDARTFQGKEREIMFLSMVAAPNEVGAPLSRDTFAQRFNVAASRARDRMYLVRSVELVHLSQADRLRRSLIAHFAAPFAQDEVRVQDLRKLCESPFEREMYDELVQRGYWVTPQVRVGHYRIDMVVEGHNDARLAIECDGDKYHGADKWNDDMQRQRVLERAGWVFWRCFASAFIRRRPAILEELVATLADRGVEPIGSEGAPRSVHSEHRVMSSVRESSSTVELARNAVPEVATPPDPAQPVPRTIVAEGLLNRAEAQVEVPRRPSNEDQGLFDRGRGAVVRPRVMGVGAPLGEYVEYSGPPGRDPREVGLDVVADGIVQIVQVEGPAVAKRVYDIYLRSCGIKRMGHELKGAMNKALARAIRDGRVITENERGDRGLLFSVVRMVGTPQIRLRSRGTRSFEEIPASELLAAAEHVAEGQVVEFGSEEHFRIVLELFDLKRLTTQVANSLMDILQRRMPSDDTLPGDGQA
jgi:very-short-patch-repair endonuclease